MAILSSICVFQCSIYIFLRDNVDWGPELEAEARLKVSGNSEVVFTEEQIEQLETNADKHWDAFYNIHSNR